MERCLNRQANMDFNGKVVLVTGSSSGIGKETAIQFAKLGANLVVNGRDVQRVNLVKEECERVSPFDRKSIGVVADLTVDSNMKKLIEKCITHFGKLDVLVNNAGYTEFRGIDDTDLVHVFERMYRTNLRPCLYLTQLAIPHLANTKGCIVNISSTCALKPELNMLPSNILDAGKDMITKTLAVVLGPKWIRVNSVRPGWIQTETTDGMGLKFEEMEDIQKQPIKKIGRPEDVANCVLFLASDKSAFITGECLQTDGGAVYA